MTPLQLELTYLIGKKELTFGCKVSWKNREELWNDDIVTFVNGNEFATKHTPINEKRFNVEIIGHPATLPDFHRWMNEKRILWSQVTNIRILKQKQKDDIVIIYNSSKDLLDQEPSTLEQIVSLIKENK